MYRKYDGDLSLHLLHKLLLSLLLLNRTYRALYSQINVL